MSNERARRRREERIKIRAFIDENDVGRLLRTTGVDMRLDGTQLEIKAGADPGADAKPGEHVWIVTMVHRVNPTTWFEGNQHLDLESLITFGPQPGCWLCEQPWSEVKDLPCPGEPPGLLQWVTQ